MEQGSVSLKEVVQHGLLAPPRDEWASMPPPQSGAPAAATPGGSSDRSGGGAGAMQRSGSGASVGSMGAATRLSPARLPSMGCVLVVTL